MATQTSSRKSLTLKQRNHIAVLEKRKLRTELKLKELEAQLDELTLQINRLKRKGV